MSRFGLPSRLLTVAGLIVLATGAIFIRALGFEYVFVGDEVVFPPADPQYHLRRAFFTMAQFPDVLLFDPYKDRRATKLYRFVRQTSYKFVETSIRDRSFASRRKAPQACR